MEIYTLKRERYLLQFLSEGRIAFKDMHAGMNRGFGGTFNPPENYLKSKI